MAFDWEGILGAEGSSLQSAYDDALDYFDRIEHGYSRPKTYASDYRAPEFCDDDGLPEGAPGQGLSRFQTAQLQHPAVVIPGVRAEGGAVGTAGAQHVVARCQTDGGTRRQLRQNRCHVAAKFAAVPLSLEKTQAEPVMRAQGDLT